MNDAQRDLARRISLAVRAESNTTAQELERLSSYLEKIDRLIADLPSTEVATLRTYVYAAQDSLQHARLSAKATAEQSQDLVTVVY